MAKSTDTDRIAALERQISMLKAFLDSEHREKRGLALDQIRALWFGADARPPTAAAAQAAGRSAVTKSQDGTLQWPTPLAPM